jgi:hypothetical protein
MPSKYDVETNEINFLISMTTQILILFVLVLFIFSIIFPRENMLPLTLIFVVVAGIFLFNIKTMVKKWKRKWY